MKEAAKMRNSPEFQAAMKKMQKSPEFKEAMKQANAMTDDPNTFAKMQAKVEHMVNVGQSELKKKAKEDMAGAMDALYSNPEVMEEAKKLVSDPNFASYIKEMATDPAFKNYLGAVRMFRNLFCNILMTNFLSDLLNPCLSYAWYMFVDERNDGRSSNEEEAISNDRFNQGFTVV
jgi:uncharacterized protein with von Willebrand factor type A (vWA) domain